jgi:hypothetical protein
MPSESFENFYKKLLPDVSALIKTHADMNPSGRGRRKLAHITRSGVVMLCAAWELYIEDVALESVRVLTKEALIPDFLPDSIRGKIAQKAKNDKHNFGALKLCGQGWRQVYIDGVQEDVSNLNTPKFGNIKDIFSNWFDLPDISKVWTNDTDCLNEFVSLRGEIAHRGASAGYVTIVKLTEFSSLIQTFVNDTDNGLSEHLEKIGLNKKKPWRKQP